MNIDLVNPTVAEELALKLEQEVLRLGREVVLLAKQKEAIAKRNAVLVAENAELGYRLSNQELRHKAEQFELAERVQFAIGQIGQAQTRIAVLEKESDRLNNFIAGHVVQRDQEYENMRGNVSYLMGAHQP